MKYAHLADLHLGAWREPKLRELSTQAFLTAIEQCIQQEVDFILFAGDLFNTSLPALDTLKIVTKTLKRLQEKNIPLYVIAGSHDFSPSNRSMLDVLEHAGLILNVCKGYVDSETKELHLRFTIDQKTGAKITGLLGRRGLLDKTYYQNLHRTNLEQEEGYKIFLFHTTITEMKPIDLAMMDSTPISFLPKHFNYYAGGHIHHPTKVNLPEYGTATYTGALWPNSFSEVEKYGQGGYYIIEVNGKEQEVTWHPLEVCPHFHLTYDCTNKSPEVVTFEVINYFAEKKCNGSLITIRLVGQLTSGRLTDINFKKIISSIESFGALAVLRNTNKLQTSSFEEVKISSKSPEQIEAQVITEHLQQSSIFPVEVEEHLTRSLLTALNTIKQEGETVADFQKRVKETAKQLLQL